jgi:hypothetical protein
MARNCVYIPDYTVKVTEDCLLIKVTSVLYKQALISTKLKLKTLETEEQGDDEEFDAHVIYDEDEDVSDSNSMEAFTTPGTTPMLRRANKTNNTKV